MVGSTSKKSLEVLKVEFFKHLIISALLIKRNRVETIAVGTLRRFDSYKFDNGLVTLTTFLVDVLHLQKTYAVQMNGLHGVNARNRVALVFSLEEDRHHAALFEIYCVVVEGREAKAEHATYNHVQLILVPILKLEQVRNSDIKTLGQTFRLSSGSFINFVILR